MTASNKSTKEKALKGSAIIYSYSLTNLAISLMIKPFQRLIAPLLTRVPLATPITFALASLFQFILSSIKTIILLKDQILYPRKRTALASHRLKEKGISTLLIIPSALGFLFLMKFGVMTPATLIGGATLAAAGTGLALTPIGWGIFAGFILFGLGASIFKIVSDFKKRKELRQMTRDFVHHQVKVDGNALSPEDILFTQVESATAEATATDLTQIKKNVEDKLRKQFKEKYPKDQEDVHKFQEFAYGKRFIIPSRFSKEFSKAVKEAAKVGLKKKVIDMFGLQTLINDLNNKQSFQPNMALKYFSSLFKFKHFFKTEEEKVEAFKNELIDEMIEQCLRYGDCSYNLFKQTHRIGLGNLLNNTNDMRKNYNQQVKENQKTPEVQERFQKLKAYQQAHELMTSNYGLGHYEKIQQANKFAKDIDFKPFDILNVKPGDSS